MEQNTDIDTKTVANIVARIKKAGGTNVDEQQLAIVLNNSLAQLKIQNPQKYIDTLNSLSNQLEQIAKEINGLKLEA